MNYIDITIDFVKNNEICYLELWQNTKYIGEKKAKNFISKNFFKKNVFSFNNLYLKFLINKLLKEGNFLEYRIIYRLNSFFFDFIFENDIKNIELFNSNKIKNIIIDITNKTNIDKLYFQIKNNKIKLLKIINNYTYNKDLLYKYNIDTEKKEIENLILIENPKLEKDNIDIRTIFKNNHYKNINIENFKSFDYNVIKENIKHKEKYNYINNKILLKNIIDLKNCSNIENFDNVHLDNIKLKNINIISKNLETVELKNNNINNLNLYTYTAINKLKLEKCNVNKLKIKSMIEKNSKTVSLSKLCIKDTNIKEIEVKNKISNIEIFEPDDLKNNINLLENFQTIEVFFNLYTNDDILKFAKLFNILLSQKEKFYNKTLIINQSLENFRNEYLNSIHRKLRKEFFIIDNFDNKKTEEIVYKLINMYIENDELKDFISNIEVLKDKLKNVAKKTKYKINVI